MNIIIDNETGKVADISTIAKELKIGVVRSANPRLAVTLDNEVVIVDDAGNSDRFLPGRFRIEDDAGFIAEMKTWERAGTEDLSKWLASIEGDSEEIPAEELAKQLAGIEYDPEDSNEELPANVMTEDEYFEYVSKQFAYLRRKLEQSRRFVQHIKRFREFMRGMSFFDPDDDWPEEVTKQWEAQLGESNGA